jgi:pimeloyl-ACP methyl ester carboxylesterase
VRLRAAHHALAPPVGDDRFRFFCPRAIKAVTKDLKKITVPVLVMHSEDDQIVPYSDSGPLSAKLLKNGTLKTYKGFPHGMPTTQAETINADLLTFLKG